MMSNEMIKEINQKIDDGIESFHNYIRLGMTIEWAKEKILSETCIVPLKEYIREYQA